MLSFPDIAVLSGLALIVFGPDQMPKIARQVGQFMGTMRSTSNAFMREMDAASLENLVKPPASRPADTTHMIGGPALQPAQVAHPQLLDEAAAHPLPATEYAAKVSALAPEIPTMHDMRAAHDTDQSAAS